MVTKEEAKSIVAYAFRNTCLEDVHVGGTELDDETMRELMKEAVNKVYFLLKLRDETRCFKLSRVQRAETTGETFKAEREEREEAKAIIRSFNRQ